MKLATLVILLASLNCYGCGDKPNLRLSRPNIVLILADDLGYGDPGCYNADSKMPTPNIDRLASGGIRFTDAHSPASVCSPTRYAILTGRYAWRTELKRSVLWPWDRPLIEKQRLTLPAMLQQQGYLTACIGKWHLGWRWLARDGSRIEDHARIGIFDRKARQAFGKQIDFSRSIGEGPTTRGFDYYFGTAVPNFPPYCFIENDRTLGIPDMPKPASMFGNPGPMVKGWELRPILAKLTEKAVAFIDRSAGREQPFFLYFPLTAPHTPIVPAEAFTGASAAGKYGDFVNEVDWVVGQVAGALRRNGIDKRTLVIFTSDNGSPARDGTDASGQVGAVRRYGHDPSGGLRGLKGDAWEGGHRVPFVVSWPGRVPADRTCDALLSQIDLFRSLAALVGAKIPDEAAEDSANILPVLLGERTDHASPKSVVHHSFNGTFAIRSGMWKLIMGRSSGGFTQYKPPKDAPAGQLFDLASDLAEQNNRYLESPHVVRALEDQLERIRDERGRLAID